MSPKHFFKNIKKNKNGNRKKSESPSNSRKITEQAKLVKLYGLTLKIFVAVVFVVAIIVVGYDLQKNLQTKQGTDSQREAIISDLNFWENFIAEHQNYRDAYLQASTLEYRLGDTSQAKMYVEKALSLDQNSIDGKKLKKFFANK